MSNVQSYNALIDRFHAFASGHFILKRFSHGQIEVSDLEKFGEYPFMHVVPSNVTYAKGMKTFSFQIVLADMPRDKEEKSEYQREVLSDLQRIAEDLVAEITNHRVLFGDLITVQNVSLEPFLEEFQHTLTGWTISLDLLVPYYWDACSIPAEWNDFFESGSGGTGSILTFIDSITRDENGNVSLVNDEAEPSPNYYYGTNDEGVRGWYLLEDEIGLTCETIGDCQTIIDIEAAIDALEEDVTDLQGDVSSLETNKVPYTGATQAVNLGAFDLTVNELTVGKGTNGLANNTALGHQALFHTTTGNYNTAAGHEAGHNLTTGQYNTALGQSAMFTATTASQNTAVGLNALLNTTSGGSNVAVGLDSLQHNTTGSSNTAVGYNAGSHITDGTTPNTTASNSIFIGRDTKAKVNGGANEIVIGQNAIGNGTNTATIGNSSITANYFNGSVNGGSFVKSGGTSSQFLKADGSIDSSTYVPTTRTLTINGTTQDLSADRTFTIATGLTVGTTPITSGTVGRVLFEGTGNVLQESANFFWDNTNARLGIGTASPAYRLDVTGNSRFLNDLIVGNTTAAPNLQLGPPPSGNYGATLKMFGYNSSFKNWEFSVGLRGQNFNITPSTTDGGSTFTTPAFSIATTGNVLIGTTTDAGYKLDVNGNSRVKGAGATDSTSAFLVQNSAGNTGLTVGNGLTVIVHQDLQLVNTVIYWNAGSQIRNISNGVLRITNSSNSDFTRLQFGGGTSSFPALQRSGASLCVVDGAGTTSANLLIGTTTTGSSKFRVVGLPTSSAGLSAGDVWNDAGTLKIV